MSDPAMRTRALASARAAYIARHTDESVLKLREGRDSRYSDILTLDEFSAYCISIWKSEGRTEPLMVSHVDNLPSWVGEQFEDFAAKATWDLTGQDAWGMPRTGIHAGTTGPMPYIDVRDDGLSVHTALHELAHLLVDTRETALGHGDEWAGAAIRLITNHISPDVAALWGAYYVWWWDKAAAKIAENPEWLAGLLDRA